MKIDLDHLHFWMQAIRQSPDPMRTMDAFWQGQLKSKEWLIDRLEFIISPPTNKLLDFPISVDIHGGWVGVLSSMLFQSNIPIDIIRSIDIDPACKPIAELMNKSEEIAGRFQAVTADMCDIESSADVVINTSCEHVTQEKYELWLSKVSSQSLIVLQSNNYKIDEHIRTADSLDEFIRHSKLSKVEYSDKMILPLYTRWMIIGYK